MNLNASSIKKAKANKGKANIAKTSLLPEGTKILLHSCCAPCSCDVIRRMVEEFLLDVSIYFYNPNIHPLKEYNIRKQENIRYAEKLGIPFIDADYDVQNWFAKAKGMEDDPERGRRCTMCFDMRFERTADYAHNHGFSFFTSSLGISRWKNMEQINDCGKNAAKKYENLEYFDYNWRLDGGAAQMYKISKEEHFYKQQYCGCIYSLRDSNIWREKNDRPRIETLNEYY